MRLIISIGLFCISMTMFGRHPVHFTVVNMEMKNDSLNIDYSIRIFQEDYVNLISIIYSDVIHNSIQGSKILFDTTLVPKYFIKNLEVAFDNKYIVPEYAGQKNTESDVWLFFKINLNEIPDEINIKNKIFTEFYSDQTNLLIFSIGNREKGLTFDARTTEQLFKLKNIL